MEIYYTNIKKIRITLVTYWLDIDVPRGEHGQVVEVIMLKEVEALTRFASRYANKYSGVF